MGLIRAALDAAGSVMADQWLEYFYCDTMSNDVLVKKGQKTVNEGRNSNRKGSDNIITNGSGIVVNEGQCMMIVEEGMVVEVCAEPGKFTYDMSSEPSLFYGGLGEGIKNTFSAIGRRFIHGGNTGKDQRVYYFNIKENMSNLFGTANPIPFRVVDNNIGLDVDITVRCNGEYSFKLVDPLLFYKNVCGNVQEEYTRSQIVGQMKAELMNALQPAFAKISALGVRYSAIPAHNMEVTDALNEVLSAKWRELRGIEMVSISINSIKASEEDEEMIKELQRTAVLRNPGMAAATMVSAQTDSMRMGAEAMKAAASNTATGPMLAFAGMNMASMSSNANMQNFGGGMMNAQQLFQMDAQNQANMQAQAQNAAQMQAQAQQKAAAQAPVLGWSCSCGKTDNRGKFCAECGTPKPQEAGWTCGCGTVNQGKFCMECGSKKPEGAPIYKCDKCGWEPEDPAHPPKFCPECGDIFDDNDKQ